MNLQLDTEIDARDALAPLLVAMARAVRDTSHRVVATRARRRRGDGGAAAGSGAGDEDKTEAVHDFRVAIRRLRTVLRVMRRPFGPKRIRRASAELKRFADATGRLRDEEVLAETLSDLDVASTTRQALGEWVGRRKRQERVLRAAVVHLLERDGDVLDAILEQLGRALEHRPPEGAVTLHGLAEHAVGGARAAVLAAAAAEPADATGEGATGIAARSYRSRIDPDDVTAMHDLRIRYKRLRYTAELFAEALGAPADGEGDGAALSRRAKGAAKLQKRLGEVHDLDVAQVRMSRAWGLATEHRLAVLEALRAARVRAAERAVRDLAADLES